MTLRNEGDPMIVWNKTQARELRLRLGWTQADLARRLHVEVQEITEWELGQKNPDNGLLADIEFLLKQADLCSEEVQKAPLIETELEANHLNQLHSDEVYPNTESHPSNSETPSSNMDSASTANTASTTTTRTPTASAPTNTTNSNTANT